MRRSVIALVGALLALAITTSLAVAAAPPANSPWDSTGNRCQTPNGLPGTTYVNAFSGTELCFAS